MALQTSPEAPAAVRTIAAGLAGWLNKLGAVWVEGQLTDVSTRGSSVFGTLRDTDADVSLRFSCPPRVFTAVQPQLGNGSRVLAHAKVSFYVRRGTLALDVRELRHIGIGELLARLEHRKQLLAAEGLFAPHLKQPLPFLPGTVGLICGRDSAAERDVVDNAHARWPAVGFRIENTSVQGARAAADLIIALQALDRDPAVEVIVIARGGGSLEDLLAFSDEGLVRAVAVCRTPVISAIGHESDQPLLDLVADRRASTPTDAAKQVVPDVREQLHGIGQLRSRSYRAIRARLDHDAAHLAGLRSRPCLAAPVGELDRRSAEIADWLQRNRRTIGHRLERAGDDLGHRLARVRSLSPRATMERGYAVLQDADGAAIRRLEQVNSGQQLTAWVSDGRFGITVSELPAAEPGGRHTKQQREEPG